MIVTLTAEGLNIPEFISLANEFYEEGRLPGKFTIEAFIHNWKNLISNDIGVIWIALSEGSIDGALGAMLYPDINSGELTAIEAFWFMTKEARSGKSALKLFKTFEAWARNMKAKRIIMAHLHNLTPEKLKRFYEAKGYKAIETHYMKEL